MLSKNMCHHYHHHHTYLHHHHHHQLTIIISTFIILSSMLSCLVQCQKPNISRPPTITEHPDKEMTFRLREEVTIPCKASGNPEPTYTWKKDDKELNLDNNIDLHIKPGEGSLVIATPTNRDEGYYQCFSKNQFGVASSVRALLKEAFHESFPTIKEARKFEPYVGESLTLNCTPPNSYPAPTVYWGLIKTGEKFTPLDNTNRINADYSGNLYFSNIDASDGQSYICHSENFRLRSIVEGDDAVLVVRPVAGNFYFSNIEMEDSRDGSTYICLSQNSVLRSLNQGDDCVITPKKKSGDIRPHPPKLMWSTPKNDLSLTGQTKKMKCIFSGYPTPDVTWKKEEGDFPSKIEYPQKGGLTNEIVISNVDISDQGWYECKANNSKGQYPHRVHLTVESAPFWKDHREPEEINTSEDENAIFTCAADGIPKPNVEWAVNGVPLEDLPVNPKRIFDREKNQLTYLSVSSKDYMVVQCNASNKHGYIIANLPLSVYAEPPSFKISPEPVTKVAEGRQVVLKCRSTGAPKPFINWVKDGVKIDGGRFKVEDNGSLVISNAEPEDSGAYTCNATNKFGSDSVTGRLLVRRPTEISKPVEPSLFANVSSPVVLYCNVTTDDEEKNRLKITWYKDDVPLTFDDGEAAILNSRDMSLTFNNVQLSDQGSYKCLAKNDVDNDTVEYNLIVKGPPNPPEDVTVECFNNTATIRWQAGEDNNDPIKGYNLYCNTSWDPVGVYHEHGKKPIAPNEFQASFLLNPWNNYTFHITATNNIGVSERSLFTPLGECNTAPSVPLKNPENVCTDSKNPGELFIKWESLRPEFQAGEGFHYLISYTRMRTQDTIISNDGGDDNDYGDETNDEEVIEKVYDLNRNFTSIKDVGVYRAFTIYVQSANNMGKATNVKKIIGYSGQGKPRISPQNFDIREETLTSKSVVFEWDPVSEDVSLIQGFFRGYQVKFWRVSHPDDVRTEDVIIRPWNPCSGLSRKKRRMQNMNNNNNNNNNDNNRRHNKRNNNHNNNHNNHKKVTAHVNNLWPDAAITAGVLVLNGGTGGDLGEPITFQTPEGVPSKVEELKVLERGSDHLKIKWDPPEEINGNLTGYEIEYKRAPPHMDQKKKIEINDPKITEKKLLDLKPDTNYLVYIYGLTNAGRGDEAYLEDKTREAAPPTPPILGPIEIGDDYVNISWTPTDNPDDPKQNPGSKFAIEYKPTDHSDDDLVPSKQGQEPKKDKPQSGDADETKDGGDDYDDNYEYDETDDDGSDGGRDDDDRKKSKEEDEKDLSKSGTSDDSISKKTTKKPGQVPGEVATGKENSEDGDHYDEPSIPVHPGRSKDDKSGSVDSHDRTTKSPDKEEDQIATKPVPGSTDSGTGDKSGDDPEDDSWDKDGSYGSKIHEDSSPKDKDKESETVGSKSDPEDGDSVGPGGVGSDDGTSRDKDYDPSNKDDNRPQDGKFSTISPNEADSGKTTPKDEGDKYRPGDPQVLGPKRGPQDNHDVLGSDSKTEGESKQTLSPKRKRPKKKGKWIRTIPEAENNWINVTGLKPGATYNFRVVATNNQGKEAKTNSTRIVVIPETKKIAESRSAGLNWLLILLLLLLLLLLLACLILLCCIKCNRGGVYPVYEKEKLRGHDSLKEEDEAGFGEYTRADDPPLLKGAKGSMDSVEKPLEESETDSLGEYEDPDPSKFNEDGSFIGQYGGKKKGGGGADEVATPTTALSSFV